MKKLIILAAVIVCASRVFAQKFDDLAKTPPLGWNSWNKFGCNVSEQLIRETADAIAANGMRDAGYQYVVIDDCWHGTRDANGFIQPNAARFPGGIKALADYVHSKNLKIGIYSDAGAKTCGGHPGSRGHEYQDALTYANWGIDYLKYDWCNTEGLKAEGAYATMRDALYTTKRPILFSICEWGDNKPWEWAKTIGHQWRTTGDIHNCWDCEINHGTWSSWGIMKILDKQKDLRVHAAPGHWNDPDMLEVGNGLSANEDRAHFSMWAMLAAPLIAGNDVRNMNRATTEILTNKEVIAVDQDQLGVQGFKYNNENDLETWLKPLSNGEWAVCFLNRGSSAQTIEYDWKHHGVTDGFSKMEFDAAKTEYKIRDLWSKKNLGTTATALKTVVPSHDVVMLRLTK